jgi:hypothetical protein
MSRTNRHPQEVGQAQLGQARERRGGGSPAAQDRSPTPTSTSCRAELKTRGTVLQQPPGSGSSSWPTASTARGTVLQQPPGSGSSSRATASAARPAGRSPRRRIPARADPSAPREHPPKSGIGKQGASSTGAANSQRTDRKGPRLATAGGRPFPKNPRPRARTARSGSHEETIGRLRRERNSRSTASKVGGKSHAQALRWTPRTESSGGRRLAQPALNKPVAATKQPCHASKQSMRSAAGLSQPRRPARDNESDGGASNTASSNTTRGIPTPSRLQASRSRRATSQNPISPELRQTSPTASATGNDGQNKGATATEGLRPAARPDSWQHTRRAQASSTGSRTPTQRASSEAHHSGQSKAQQTATERHRAHVPTWTARGVINSQHPRRQRQTARPQAPASSPAHNMARRRTEHTHQPQRHRPRDDAKPSRTNDSTGRSVDNGDSSQTQASARRRRVSGQRQHKTTAAERRGNRLSSKQQQQSASARR